MKAPSDGPAPTPRSGTASPDETDTDAQGPASRARLRAVAPPGAARDPDAEGGDGPRGGPTTEAAPDDATGAAPAARSGGKRAGTAKAKAATSRKAGSAGTAKAGGKTRTRPAAPTVEVRPVAGHAKMRQRHWGLAFSFVGLVLVPLVLSAFYLWIFATDQYASTTGFIVRQEEGGGASELIGGLAQLTGGSASSDGDILYEFIQSQEMVREVDEALDLRSHYSAPVERDPVFALWPGATIEDLRAHWQRMVQIAYDQGTGLIEVQVRAFDPDMAHDIAREIVELSQAMINDLNLQAREDAMGYARADLDEALERLKRAREALTQFRTRTQIVDPETDIQSRMGVMANLQQQLAQALIDFDLLQQTTSEGDPRLRQGRQRIEVIRQRIASERQSFATDQDGTGLVGEDYPSLIAEYEGLSVDRQFAEETYRAALTALDLARDQAQRQSRYLATYIAPTRPETSEYPQRAILTGLVGLFMFLLWSVLTLVYYSIRDRG